MANFQIKRRRAQVRVAQRAYRNREKVLIANLRKEVDDLKTRLTEMQNISNDWFRLVRALPSLSEEDKHMIQELRAREKSSQIKSSETTETEESMVFHETSENSPSTQRALNVVGRSPDRSEALPFAGATSMFSIFSSADLKTSQPDIRILPTPGVGVNEPPLAFSLRLRDHALKGAYRLIASPETPYTTLIERFRNCIFVSTRDQIKNRLALLIREFPNTPPDSTSSPPPGEYQVCEVSTPRQPMDIDDHNAIPKKSLQYLDTAGVHEYLASKGLNVDPKSPFAEFSMDSPKSDSRSASSSATIFEEIRQRQRIRINVNKLLRGNVKCSSFSRWG